MQFFQTTNIDFLSKRKLFYIISGVLILIGLGAFFAKGLTLGIDFVGGTEVLVKFQNEVQINEIRTSMERTGVIGSEIKTMGDDRSILIRTSEQGDGTQ